MPYLSSSQPAKAPVPLPGGPHRTRRTKKKSILFDAFVSRLYLPYARQYKSSWDVDERIARRHISSTFGGRRMDTITRQDVEIWFRGLSEKGLAPATCNRILSVLKAICALALEYELFPSGQSPCTRVSPRKGQTVREHYLTGKQAKQVMHELDCSHLPQATVIKLLMLTGARKSEILKARWEHLHLEQRLLTVPISKSGKARHIALPDAAVAVFRSIRRIPGCPWVFPGQVPGKPLSDIYRFWNDLRHRLGLQDIRVHDLRHTFASLLVNVGHSLYAVQKLLGHADPCTTMRYAHLGQSALLAAVQSVGAFLVQPARKPRRAQRITHVSRKTRQARTKAFSPRDR